MSTSLLLFIVLATATLTHCADESWEENSSEDNSPHIWRVNSRNKVGKVISVRAFTCTAPGIFPDPDPLNCRTYYRCSTKLVLSTYTCPGTSSFNPATLKCTATTPPTCVPTTTTAPTTPTTPPTTPSTAPTTLSTTPPTAPPTDPTTLPAEPTSSPTEPTATPSTMAPTEPTTPLPPYVCTAGGIFAEPSDCKTYYRCTTTLIATTYTCPGASLFDPVRLVCTMTTPAKCLPTTTLPPTTTPLPA